MFEDCAWFAPFLETCTATKLPWAHTGAPRSFEAFPPVEAFDALLAEYRTGARRGYERAAAVAPRSTRGGR
ncbi:MAG: hypothetical protein KF850_21860 [Labilithrix sp.]|nr:hypothetical protein [Labilithrix sp.]